MEVSTREAKKIFSKLGVKERRSTHHVAGVVVIDGVARLPVHYSHGRKGLAGRAAQSFRKSLRLKPEEFAVLKRCTMTRDEYVALVRSRV
jgi:hypothetical protein